MTSGDRLRGITKILERIFWPRYDFDTAARGLPRAPPNPEGATRGPRSARGGMRRGSKVDAEVCASVNSGVAPKHPYARRVLRALEVAGLRPMRAQVRVQDEEAGLFTGVDLLCKRGNRFVIVEIKCGFSRPGIYDSSCGMMLGCLSDLTDCPKNQHAAQTAVTLHLFRKTYPDEPSPEAVVLRVSDDGVYLHPVPTAILRRAPTIVAAVSAARARVRPGSRR